MIKKTAKYEDFMGNERTEELFFNLTQAELVDMAMDLPDDVTKTIADDPSKVNQEVAAQALISSLGTKGIFEFIKKLLLKSYGIPSSDGRRFEKSEEITKEFSQSLAYDTILMELMSNDVDAANFVNGVIPSSVAKKMNNVGNIQALPSNGN